MTSSLGWFRALEYFGLATSLLCGTAIATALWRDLDTVGEWMLALGTGMLGYLAADFVTGLVHWAGDRLGSPRTPVFGASVIAPFREHHADPQNLTRHDFVELCGSSFILVAAIWLPTWLLASPTDEGLALALRAFMFSLGVWTGITNQLHCWAHQRTPGAIVVGLQRCRLILSPERHALHHTPPFEGHYCVTTGWCNGLLARTRFFERVERLLSVKAPDAASPHR